MNSLERKQFIEQKCYQKNINLETQEYIKQYISLNETLFGSFLDIDNIINKVLSNLNSSIKITPVSISELKHNGRWNGFRHYIYVNPVNMILSKFLKSEKNKVTSIIMHELDHCANTKYVPISDHDKNIFLEDILKEYKMKGRKINRVKNYIDKKYKQGILPISGISDKRQSIQNNINLTQLDEGITAWKQEMYEKQLGIRPYRVYSFEKEVAKFISDMIGKENLIQMHFNNDYEGIKKLFKDNTGTELNDLVKKMNDKPKFNILLNSIPIAGKIYRRKFNNKRMEFYTDFQQSMQVIKKQHQEKRRTDFVPKFIVNSQTIDCYAQEKIENKKKNIETPEVSCR